MAIRFAVHTTPAFNRLAKRLTAQRPDLAETMAEAFSILQSDPHNLTHRHDIKKLRNVPAGQGLYRLRLGRWRFRFDIAGQIVELVYCGLRRENTY